MTIVTVGYFHGFGGAERQIIMLSNALAEYGHIVHLIALADCNIQYKVNENVIIHNLAVKEKTPKVFSRFILYKRELTKISPDVTINFIFQSAYFSALLPKSITGKVIYSERSDPYDSAYVGVIGLLRKICINRIDGFVFQSRGAQSFFSKNVQDRSVIIHNPISQNCLNFKNARIVSKKLITVGRLHPQKNHEMLIRAFKIIEQKFSDWNLEIYGDGELYEYLQTIITDLGLTNRVSILPSNSDIYRIISNSSIFVLSSNYEGMPNVLLESMALGLPCISTDCRPGGARELIKNGWNGIIVPRFDVTELAKQIEWLIEHPTEAKAIGENARLIRNNHTSSFIYHKWDVFINKLVG